MKKSFVLFFLCSMLSLCSWGKVYEITYIFPKGKQLKIGNKRYKLHDRISCDEANFTKNIRLSKKGKIKNFAFTLRDVDTKKTYTYSNQYSKVENRSILSFLSDSFNNYCKNNSAVVKGVSGDEMCGNLLLKGDEIDTIASLDVIDQYNIKNIEYKRDTTILLVDSVDIRVDLIKNKEFYIIYKLNNSKEIKKKLIVDGNYVRIRREECEGINYKRYPKGVDAVLLIRNTKLANDNEISYPIKIVPLF